MNPDAQVAAVHGLIRGLRAEPLHPPINAEERAVDAAIRRIATSLTMIVGNPPEEN